MKQWDRWLGYWRLIRTFRNWPLYFLHRRGFLRQPEVLEFRTRRGYLLPLPSARIGDFHEIFLSHHYLFPAWWRDLRHFHTVIDIGANIGLFSLFAAERFPGAQILAFEPWEENFRYLEKLVRDNRLPVLPFREALSATSGTLSLHLPRSESFSSRATVFPQPPGPSWSSQEDLQIEVPAVTLEEVFRRTKLAVCDLLKMDCEGSEYAILYGTAPELLARIRRMAIEVHPGSAPSENVANLTAYLSALGFFTSTRAATEFTTMLYAWRRPPH
ncbi:FkbM family methyltransferase [Verrucomicrobium sp. 3C]|uniref:FkbM family methyltransferase n=1 Tax=Verrucomicrobium sp. 3C TaxID=1134055 RepID=UPI000365DFC0|nr:FkbM family methyltransferase [Verrucomicrobium sp. 3C]